MLPLEASPLGPGEHHRALEVVSAAFDSDPLWTWAMPDASGGVAFRRQFWSIILQGALRYPWSWLSASGNAVAVWIPPGGTERSAQGDEELTMLLGSMPPQAAERTRSVLDALERQHPTMSHGDQEPVYLSLLAVHPTQQGKGEGSALLERTLERVDGEGWPAYLESSAERNVEFYRRHGFVVQDRINVHCAPPLITMMRERSPVSLPEPLSHPKPFEHRD